MPGGQRDAVCKVLVDDFFQDEGVEAGLGGPLLGGVEQQVLRLEHPAQVGPALRAHAQPPHEPGEPGGQPSPLTQPAATFNIIKKHYIGIYFLVIISVPYRTYRYI